MLALYFTENKEPLENISTIIFINAKVVNENQVQLTVNILCIFNRTRFDYRANLLRNVRRSCNGNNLMLNRPIVKKTFFSLEFIYMS